jgi:hypothetical protein
VPRKVGQTARAAVAGLGEPDGIDLPRRASLGLSAHRHRARSVSAIRGGVSTWESLHMGVPVVTKLGDGLSTRMGHGQTGSYLFESPSGP